VVSIDESTFMTLTAMGEVRLWSVESIQEDIPIAPIRLAVYPNSPRQNQHLRSLRYEGLQDGHAVYRNISFMYRSDDGRFLDADENDKDVLLKWQAEKRPGLHVVERQSFPPNLNSIARIGDELGCNNLEALVWEDVVHRAIIGAGNRLRLPWLLGKESRIEPPGKDDDTHTWRRWLFVYLLEDEQRKQPHFTAQDRCNLISQALDVIALSDPLDEAVAIWRTDLLKYEAEAWNATVPPEPLRVVMKAKPSDHKLQLAWLALCNLRSPAVALEACTKLLEAQSTDTRLVLRCAQLADSVNPELARSLRLQALEVLGLNANVRRIHSVETFGLWEICFDGRCGLWACELPGPSDFALEGKRLRIANGQGAILC
jgi:hypothetical protein